MAKAVILGEFDYVPKCDRDERGQPVEGATVFRLCPLTGWQRQEVYLEIKQMPGQGPGGTDAIVLSGEAFRKALRFGLRGWKNFEGAEFGPNMDANLGCLGHALTSELAGEILACSELSDAQKKA